MVTTDCTTVMGLGGPPKCAADQEDGTPVSFLPLGGPRERSHALEPEVSEAVDFEVEALYATYRVAEGLREELEYLHGRFVLFFITTGSGSGRKTNILRLDEKGRIVRLDSIGTMPPDDYFEQQTADLMDPTPEARVFNSEAAEILVYPPEYQP